MPYSFNPLSGLGLDQSIPLDSAGKIPSGYLPSYVDDVEEYADLASFPATGETGKIYVAIDTGFTYRWSGSVYVQINSLVGTFAADSGTEGAPSVSIGTADNGLYAPGTDEVAISTNGSERMRISNTGDALFFGNIRKDNASSSLIVSGGNGSDSGANIVLNGQAGSPLNTIQFRYGSSESMRIDSSGRLGLGTSSPAAQLDVAGDALFGNGFDASSTTTDGLKIDANGAIFNQRTSTISTLFGGYYQNSQTVKITADGSATFAGSVGIGTTSPQAILHTSKAHGSATVGTGLLLADTTSGGSAGTGVAIAARVVSNSVDTGKIEFIYNGGSDYPIIFKNWNGSTATERCRIDGSGRLLVGTSTAPGSTTSVLVVNGNTSGSSQQGELQLNNGVTPVENNYGLGAIKFSGETTGKVAAQIQAFADAEWNTGGDTTDNPGRLVFSTTADGASSPTERMSIKSDGQVVITPGRLYVQNSEASNPLVFAYNTNNAASDITYKSELGAGSNGTSAYHFYGVTGGSGKFAIYGNGTYGTISDQNLKTHIEPARDGYLADLNQIKIVKYGWKSDELGHATELGVIAQEVEQVFPGLVQECPPNEDGEVFKGVKTSVFTFMLIKALQEASSKIESLESRIAALEAQ